MPDTVPRLPVNVTDVTALFVSGPRLDAMLTTYRDTGDTNISLIATRTPKYLSSGFKVRGYNLKLEQTHPDLATATTVATDALTLFQAVTPTRP